MASFAEVASQEKDNGPKLLKNVTSNLIFNMLRYRSEYESMIRGDNQVEQNRFANIINGEPCLEGDDLWEVRALQIGHYHCDICTNL